MSAYPIALDGARVDAVIVGGGSVAERKAKALAKKNPDQGDSEGKMLEKADTAMRQCFNERARSQSFFPALVKQARELVERVR